jgi:hypothetical protein
MQRQQAWWATCRTESVARFRSIHPAAVCRSMGERNRDGETAGNDVVHLSGDRGAFGRHREKRLLVPLMLQLLDY